MEEGIKIKYVGNELEVVNIFGVFKKDILVSVTQKVADVLLKNKKEFVQECMDAKLKVKENK